LLGGIELSEWRLVGPGLAALIVALALRFRLSRARIQEFLAEWLGLELSIGTIHQTIHEASAAVAPAEEALVAAVLASDLLHADETSWPEARQTLWLSAAGALAGVFVSARAAGERCLDRLFDSGLRYSRQPCSQSTGRLT
jgi:transposase